MIKLIFVLFIFSFSNFSQAGKVNKHNVKDKEIFKQMKIESGSILVLNQYLKEQKIEGEVILQFKCIKVKKSRECEVFRFDTVK